MVKPATKKEVVAYLVSEYPMNIRQECKSLNLEQSSYYYPSKRKDDTNVIDYLNQLSEKHPSYGFKKIFNSLRNEDFFETMIIFFISTGVMDLLLISTTIFVPIAY